MNSISQVVEGRVLGQVITLPKSLQESMVRITIVPIADKEVKKTKKITRKMLQDSLKGSQIEALTGILKDAKDIDLKEMQAERRALKYECPD